MTWGQSDSDLYPRLAGTVADEGELHIYVVFENMVGPGSVQVATKSSLRKFSFAFGDMQPGGRPM